MKHPWLRLPLTYKNFLRAIALSTSLSSSAYALDLGEMKVSCEPEEPFRATIRVIDLPRSTSGVYVGLATKAEFSEAIIEMTPEVRKLKFTGIEKKNGHYYIIVQSDAPLRDESLHFLMAVEGPNSRVLREYVVIAEDDVYSAHAQPSLIELTREYEYENEPVVELPLPYIAMGTVRATPYDIEVEDEPVYKEEKRVYKERESTQVYKQGQYRVQPGQNLWQIAEDVQAANPDASFYQVLAALYEANSNAFINGDINQLRAGANLTIPSASALANVDQQSVRDVKARMGGYAAQPVQSAEGIEVIEEISETSDSPEASMPIEAELRILTPKDSGEVSGQEGASDGLALANEELLQAERENEELMMRVQALQNQINTLQEVLDVREGNGNSDSSMGMEDENVSSNSHHMNTLPEHHSAADTLPGLDVEQDGVMSNSRLWDSLTSNQWFNYLALGIGAIILLLVSLALFRQNRGARPVQKPAPKMTPSFQAANPVVKKPGMNPGNHGHNGHAAKAPAHHPKKAEETARSAAVHSKAKTEVPASAAEEDKIEAKLELARAYHDLGDDDNAVTLLQEVLWEGDTKQRKSAKEWLDTIDEERKV